MSGDAYERWLYGDKITADEARELIATCPTCTECPSPRVAPHDHHWIESFVTLDNPEDVAEWRDGHPHVELTEDLATGHYECSHCPAVIPYDALPDEDDW
jgi:hypothetical protein